MAQPFKLIALDMDGTLLRADKTLHPDTAADIAAAAEAGIEIAYCTGRSPVELLPYVRELSAMRYAIALSGAYVCDLKGGCLFERLIPQELVLRLVEEGEKYGAMVHLLTADRSAVRADLIPRMAEFHMAAYQSFYERVAAGVPDMKEEALCHKGAHKVNLYFRSPGDRKMAFDALKDLPLTFAFMEGTMLEASAAGVSKAEGLRALAGHLGISMSETMAIGDSDNDIPVLEAAGFSLAMKNSEENVIRLCDAVTDDNESNGVGKAIRKYCLAACSDTAAQAEDVCGVLLRGGRSRRMGCDKASLPWENGTFLQAVAARLDMYSEKYLSVSADPGAASGEDGISPDWVVLPDRVPDCGPVGGICTALSACSAGWAMVVSCDVPRIEESFFRVLMANRTADSEVVYPVTSDGRMHLTCALYRKSLLPVLEQNIAAHDYRLRSILDRCRSVAVPLDSAQDSFLEEMLENINTREDLERAKNAHENRGRRVPLNDMDLEKMPLTGSREFYLQDDGIHIHCKLDFPDSTDREDSRKLPLLIIFHGFTGHMEEDHIRAVAGTANETGYASLRAELYGHGRSGGDFRDHTLLKWISNALTVIDYARSLPFVSEILLCGHSQGGLLTMLAGAMEQEHLKAILPLSPAWMIPDTARRGEVLDNFFDPEKIPEKLAVGKGLCLCGTYLRTAQMVEVEPSIRRFKKPVLLVHGSADLAVPVDYSVRAAEIYADARLVIIPEDTHCYDFHLDLVQEAVRAFLTDLRGK